MPFKSKDKGFYQQDRRQMLGGSWSASGSETASADESGDDDGISALEGGLPALEYRANSKIPSKGRATRYRAHETTPVRQRAHVMGDTPMTAEMTAESTSGSENSEYGRARTPKMNLNSRMESSEETKHMRYNMGGTAAASAMSQNQGRSMPKREKSEARVGKSTYYQSEKEESNALPKMKRERERKVRRSKSADAGPDLLTSGGKSQEMRMLAQSIGVDPAYLENADPSSSKPRTSKSKRRSSLTASGRSSLSTSMQSKSKKSSRRQSMSSDKRSGKSRRGSEAPPDAATVPTDNTEQAAKMAEKEKAMNRLDRIKAKAIKSATKDLGVDQNNLAKVMGMPSSNTAHDKKSNSQGWVLQQQQTTANETKDEEAEMMYLAKMLGLPPSMFGIQPKSKTGGKSPKEGEDTGSIGSPRAKTLFRAAIQNVKVADTEAETDGEESEASESEEDEALPSIAPQPNSLASALGMTIDPSSSAAPVTARDFKPQSMTAEEKKVDKEKAMSRLERIKAKAIKSANKEFGVDESSLTQLVGVKSTGDDALAVTTSNERPSTEFPADEESQIRYLAESLGFPLSFFGIQQNSNAKPVSAEQRRLSGNSLSSSKSKSLFQAAIKKVKVDDAETETEGDESEEDEQNIPSIVPQPNTLASALGMTIDPSSAAPPVRERPSNPKTTTAEGMKTDVNASATKEMGVDESNLVRSMELNATGSSNQREYSETETNETSDVDEDEDFTMFGPQSGSLAEALGISINSSSGSPPPPVKKPSVNHETATVEGKKTVASTVKEMGVHKSNLVRSTGFNATGSSSQREYSETETNETSDVDEEDDFTKFRPQSGSLAEALGISTNSSSRSPPLRKAATVNATELSASISVSTREGSDEESSDEKSTESAPQFQPQHGSLAEALGMSIDPSSRALPVRRLGIKNVPKQSSLVPQRQEARNMYEKGLLSSSTPRSQPQPGTLAEALGMSIDSSSGAKPSRRAEGVSLDSYTIPLAKGGRGVTRDGPGTRFLPQAGSLAEALGISIDPSSRAPEIRYVDQRGIGKINMEDIGESAGYKDEESSSGPQSLRPAGTVEDALGVVAFQYANANRDGSDVISEFGDGIDSENAFVHISHQTGSLADALGFQAPRKQARTIEGVEDSLQNVQSIVAGSNSSPNSDDEGSDTAMFEQYVSQSGTLADALGMRGGPYSRSPAESQIDERRSNNHPHRQSEDPAEVVDMQSASETNSEDDKPAFFLPQPGSLAGALGIGIDPSSKAPPVRDTRDRSMKSPFSRSSLNPQPKGTHPSTQKGVSAEVDPRTGSLADALGMGVDPSAEALPIRTAKNGCNKPQDVFDAALIKAVEDNEGMIPVSQLETAPKQGSLAAALGMKINSNPVQKLSNPMQEGRADVKPIERGDTTPQVGSLAAALGMSLDDAFDAPSVRYADRLQQSQTGNFGAASGASQKTPKKTLFDAVVTNAAVSSLSDVTNSISDKVSPNAAAASRSTKSETHTAHPQVGSLAAALGMTVNTDQSSLPIRQTGASVSSSAWPSAPNMQEGSPPAAAATTTTTTAGLKTDDSARELPVHSSQNETTSRSAQTTKSTSTRAYTPGKKSFFDTVLTSAAAEQRPLKSKAGASRPQLGSLAAALGMSIDSAQDDSPVGGMNTATTTEGSSAAVVSNTTVSASDEVQPKVGSLATALGVTVNTSSELPRSRSRQIDPNYVSVSVKRSLFDTVFTNAATASRPSKTKMGGVQSQSGSLPAALGATLDSTQSAPSVGQNDSAKALQDSRLMKETRANLPGSRPQAGSLASALGMAIDSESSQVRSSGRNAGLDATPARKSLFGAVLSNAAAVSRNTKSQIAASQARGGSLAAALGMRVDAAESTSSLGRNDRAALGKEPSSVESGAAASDSSGRRGRRSFLGCQSKVVGMPNEPSVSGTASARGSLQKDHSGSLHSDHTDNAIAQPKRGSVAAALGMSVVPEKEHIGTDKLVTENANARPKRRSVAAALGMSVVPEKEHIFTDKPDRALGIPLQTRTVQRPPDDAIDSRPSESRDKSSSSRHNEGSLAAALGVAVGCSTVATQKHSSKATPALASSRKSLFDTVILNASAASRKTNSDTQNQLRQGSLAAALGITVDTTEEKLPVKESGTQNTATGKSSSIPAGAPPPSQNAVLPQPGSLAAALGMWVDSDERCSRVAKSDGSDEPAALGNSANSESQVQPASTTEAPGIPPSAQNVRWPSRETAGELEKKYGKSTKKKKKGKKKDSEKLEFRIGREAEKASVENEKTTNSKAEAVKGSWQSGDFQYSGSENTAAKNLAAGQKRRNIASIVKTSVPAGFVSRLGLEKDTAEKADLQSKSTEKSTKNTDVQYVATESTAVENLAAGQTRPNNIASALKTSEAKGAVPQVALEKETAGEANLQSRATEESTENTDAAVQARANQIAAALGLPFGSDNKAAPLRNDGKSKRSQGLAAYLERTSNQSTVGEGNKSPVRTSAERDEIENIFETVSKDEIGSLTDSAENDRVPAKGEVKYRRRKSLFEPVGSTQTEESSKDNLPCERTKDWTLNKSSGRQEGDDGSMRRNTSATSTQTLQSNPSLPSKKPSIFEVVQQKQTADNPADQQDKERSIRRNASAPNTRTLQRNSSSQSKKGNIFDVILSSAGPTSKVGIQNSQSGREAMIEKQPVRNEQPEHSDAPNASPPVQEFQSQPATLEEKRTHKEKAMTRLEKIKAKAIKSANNELGADEGKLAAAMGMSTGGAASPPDSLSAEGNRRMTGDSSEAQQMKLEAESSGLSAPSGFANNATPGPSSGASAGPSRKAKSLLESAVRDVSTGRKMSSLREVDEDEDETKTGNGREAVSESPSIAPQSDSLASALGMAVDTSSDASPIRERSFKPQPMTAKEKMADKQKAMSRLERIKAKALRSVQKELDVDVGGLASVMGMGTTETEKQSIANDTLANASSEEEQEQMKLLATSLGLPMSFFGVEGNLETPRLYSSIAGGPLAPQTTAVVTPGSASVPVTSTLDMKVSNTKIPDAVASSRFSPNAGVESDAERFDSQKGGDSKTSQEVSQAVFSVAEKLSAEISQVRRNVEFVMNELSQTREDLRTNPGLSEVKSELENVTRELLNAHEEIAGVKEALLAVDGKLDEFSRAFSKAKTDAESKKQEDAAQSMKSALDESEAKAASAMAKGKELEEELMKKAKSYSEKLSELQDKLKYQEKEVSQKSETINELQAGVEGEKKAQEFVATRWAETEDRLLKACSEIQEFRSLLAKEHEEIKKVKGALEEEHYSFINSRLDVFDDSPPSSVSNTKDDEEMETLTSTAILNIQRKLQLEGQRRRTLTARLKAKRKNQRRAVIDSSKLQDKLVLKLDEKAAERASPRVSEGFTFGGKYAESTSQSLHGSDTSAFHVILPSDAMNSGQDGPQAKIGAYKDSTLMDESPSKEECDKPHRGIRTLGRATANSAGLEDIAEPADATELEQELPKSSSQPLLELVNETTIDNDPIESKEGATMVTVRQNEKVVSESVASGEDGASQDALTSGYEQSCSIGDGDAPGSNAESFEPELAKSPESTRFQGGQGGSPTMSEAGKTRDANPDNQREPTRFQGGQEGSPTMIEAGKTRNANPDNQREHNVGIEAGKVYTGRKFGMGTEAVVAEKEDNEHSNGHDNRDCSTQDKSAVEQASRTAEEPFDEAVVVTEKEDSEHSIGHDNVDCPIQDNSAEQANITAKEAFDDLNDRSRGALAEEILESEAMGAVKNVQQSEIAMAAEADPEVIVETIDGGTESMRTPSNGSSESYPSSLQSQQDEVPARGTRKDASKGADVMGSPLYCGDQVDSKGTICHEAALEDEETVSTTVIVQNASLEEPTAGAHGRVESAKAIEETTEIAKAEENAEKVITPRGLESFTEIEQKLKTDETLMEVDDSSEDEGNEIGTQGNEENILSVIPDMVADAAKGKPKDAAQDDLSTETPIVSNKETKVFLSQEVTNQEMAGETKTSSVEGAGSQQRFIPEPGQSEVQEKRDTSAWAMAAIGFVLMTSFASYVAYVGSGDAKEQIQTANLVEEFNVVPSPHFKEDIPREKPSPDDSYAPSFPPIGETRRRSALKRQSTLKKKMTIGQELTTSGSEFKNVEVPLMGMSFLNVRDDERVDVFAGSSGSSDESETEDSSRSDSSESTMEDYDSTPVPSPTDLFAPSLCVLHRSMQPSQLLMAGKAARRRRRKKFLENLNAILKKELEDDMWM